MYTGSIDIDTHAGRQGRDVDLIRCCLQPGLEATDNCLIDIFNCFLKSIAFGHASRQIGAFHNIPPVFILFDKRLRTGPFSNNSNR